MSRFVYTSTLSMTSLPKPRQFTASLFFNSNELDKNSDQNTERLTTGNERMSERRDRANTLLEKTESVEEEYRENFCFENYYVYIKPTTYLGLSHTIRENNVLEEAYTVQLYRIYGQMCKSSLVYNTTKNLDQCMSLGNCPPTPLQT